MTPRRLAITLLLVAGGLVLFAVTASLLIVSSWGSTLTASRIAAAITEGSGRPARVERVEIAPLQGHARVVGLAIGDEGPLVVRVARIDVGIRLESLWRLELTIGATAQGVDVRLQPDPAAPPPRPFEMPEYFRLGPITARLGLIRVEQSRLTFEDPPKHVALEFEGLSAEGRPDRGGLELTARADTFHLRLEHFQEKLERLSAEGRIDGVRIVARRLDLNDPRHELKATAAIEAPWTRDPRLTGEVKGRLALGPLAERLGATAPLNGTAAVDVAVSGPLARPVLDGRVGVARLDVAGLDARDLSASLKLDDQALAVTDVVGRLLGGRLQGALTLPLGRPNDTHLRFRLDGADARDVARLGGGQLDVRGRLALEGDVRGDLARPLALTGQLRADGADLAMPGELAKLGVGHLRASARMAGGQIDADAEGRWPSAGLTARARLEPDQRLRVEARANTALSALPGWGAGDSIEVTARGEGRWPQVTLAAGLDLARPSVRRDAGRLDLSLTPVAGSSPRWTGTLRSRRLSLPWTEIETLDSAMAVSGDALEIPRLTARVANVPVEASGRWAWRGTGDARLAAGPVLLARLPGVPPDLALDGSARAQVEANATASGVEATARLEAERVAVAKVALGRGTGEATLRGRHLDAVLRFPERQLEATARGDLAPGQVLAARLALRGFDLASLTPAAAPGQPPALRGAITLGADLAIPVDAPRDMRGALTVEPLALTVGGLSWSSPAPIVVRIAGQRATLEAARLAGTAGTLSAGGVIWDAAARPLVSVKLDARLAGVAPQAGLGGRARAEAELSGDVGTVAGTRARASIDGDGLTLPGALAKIGPGKAHAELQLGDRVVTIGKGTVSFPGVDAEIGGRIDLGGPLELNARATARAEPLGTAMGWSDSAGTATATAALRGTLARPDGQGRLTSDRFAVAGIAVERLEVSARLQGETVRLERLTARLLGAPVRAHGEWAASGTGRAELDAGPLALERVAGLPERLALGGAVSVRAEATAARGDVKALATVQMKDARVAGLGLGSGRLTARVDGRRLQANLDLAERRITASAAGALEAGGIVDASADVATLELTPVLRHFAANPDVDTEISVAGRATARMPWDRPAALSARMRVDPVVVRARGAGLDGKGHVAARWESGALTLEQAELSGSAGTVRASGTRTADGRLDARVDARVALPALLAPVTDVSGAEGTVSAQVQLNGTVAEPSIRGEGSVAGGRIALRGLAAPLRDINARVVATPGSLRVVDATAALGGGNLRAVGEMSLSGLTLRLYRLGITARDVPVRPLEGLDMLWDADLELSGVEGRALLSGEARLVRGTYSRDLVTLSSFFAPEQAAAAQGARGLALSIRANLDDNLLVRTTMARMRVGGTLTIRGTTAFPVVLGVLEARDGTLILRGQRYELERAVVRFADPRRIEPLLDVTANTRIRDYDVTMRVTGRIRDLDMRLTSSPSLPRDQLLSLVAFGTPAGETVRGAGGALAGEAAGLVIRELLDLSGEGESPTPGPLRSIMERTRVSYTHNSEDIGRFGLRVEYEVAGPFLLAGERTAQGYYVIDGVVRLRFR